MGMRRQKTVMVKTAAILRVMHPAYLDYINAWLATKPGRSSSDLLKDAMDFYMAHFPLSVNGTDSTLLAGARSIYKLTGEISPATLQRQLHVPYQMAVKIIRELVATGDVQATDVHDLVDMAAVDSPTVQS